MKRITLRTAVLCTVLAALCSGTAFASGWEYKVVRTATGEKVITNELNKLAQEGWEVVSITPATYANGQTPNSVVESVLVVVKRSKR